MVRDLDSLHKVLGSNLIAVNVPKEKAVCGSSHGKFDGPGKNPL